MAWRENAYAQYLYWLSWSSRCIDKLLLHKILFPGIINEMNIDKNGDVVDPDTLVLNFQQSPSGAYKLV